MELTTGRRTPKCFSLPTSLLDQLDELPRRPVSRWVEEAIREKLNRNTAEGSGRQDKSEATPRKITIKKSKTTAGHCHKGSKSI